MEAQHTDTLQYGHVGRAVYLPARHSWHFSRNPANRSSSLSYTGLTKPVVPASIRSPPQELNNHEKRSYSLLNSYPELTAGSFLEEALSRAITAVTDTCDLTPSTLFCLGNAVDLESDRAGSRIIPIAAVACGENGYSLAFHRIDDELVNLEREKRYRTRVPSIGSVGPGLWIGSGAPIQQIKFSQPVEEAASWMAARFSNSTVIFRPLYHRGRVPASFAKNASQPPRMPVQNSLLDPNPIVEISSSKTGGHPHADVTFNPWYQKQIGVIDKRGDWSLWNISNKQRRKDGFADRTISGSLPWVDNEGNRSFNDGGRYDGWASIEWIGGVDKLIACDRRCIILYLIESVPIRSLPIELGLRQKSEWILDIKRSPANMSHVFILTTSRVFWLDVSHDLVSLDAGNTTSSLCPQLSWHHFRDADDTTLRLTSLLTSDDLFLFVYSRLNNLVLNFQFSQPKEEEVVPVSVPDPSFLQVPVLREENELTGSGNTISSLIFKQVEQIPIGGKDFNHPSSGLVKLFMQSTNLAVEESLYSLSHSDDYIHNEDPQLGRDALRIRRRIGVRGNKTVRDSEIDFIVADRDETNFETSLLKFGNTQTASYLPSSTAHRTIDLTAIYPAAIASIAAHPEGVVPTVMLRKPFGWCLKNLERMTTSDIAVNNLTKSQTLLELVNCSAFLDDLDQNAQAFETLTRDLNWVLAQRKYVLPLNLRCGFSVDSTNMANRTRNIDVLDLYDCLIRDWVSHMPLDMPGRVRIMKERIVRVVAAELCLSRVNVVPGFGISNERASEGETYLMSESTASAFNEGHTEQNNDDAMDISRSIPPGRVSLNDAPEEAERCPKSPENPAGSLLQHAAAGFGSLDLFTTSKDQGPLPGSVANILSHWSPGCDPSAYDWQRKSREQEEESSKTEGRLAAIPKHRVRKRSSQTLQRETHKPSNTSTIFPTVKHWGSQPQDSLPRGRLHGSQVTEEDLPMTQTERGVFGGREAVRKSNVKARKKKRAAGF